MFLKKVWARALISFFVGGGLLEYIRITTGKGDEGVLILGAVLSYILLSAGLYIYQIITLQKKVDRENYVDDEIIDDLK